jgi:hypothetical protein
VTVWAISLLAVATETMEVSVVVARLLQASVGVAADGLDVLVVRGGALGFATGGGTIGGGRRGGLMGDVVFRAGHPEFLASRGATQTCCRESMPFQMTAG